MTFNKEDEQFLAKVLPADILEALDSDTKEAATTLNELLEYKELSDPEVKEEEKAEETPTPPEVNEEEEKAVPPPEDEEDEEDEVEEVKPKQCDDEEKKPESKEIDEDRVVEAVMKVLNVEQLQTILTTLVENQKRLSDEIEALKSAKKEVEQEVKSLKQSEDEKIAAKLSPVNWGAVGFSPATAENTAVSHDDAEQKLKDAPGLAQTLTGDKTVDFFFNSIKRKE